MLDNLSNTMKKLTKLVGLKKSEFDEIVRRKGKLYVINKKNPRNKQRQG